MDNMAKITVTIKDPDVLDEAVTESVEAEVKAMNLPEDEAEMLIEARIDKTKKAMSKWWEYSEYIVVEFDMEAMSAKVIERK
jgi:hypothetical protein